MTKETTKTLHTITLYLFAMITALVFNLFAHDIETFTNLKIETVTFEGSFVYAETGFRLLALAGWLLLVAISFLSIIWLIHLAWKNSATFIHKIHFFLLLSIGWFFYLIYLFFGNQFEVVTIVDYYFSIPFNIVKDMNNVDEDILKWLNFVSVFSSAFAATALIAVSSTVLNQYKDKESSRLYAKELSAKMSDLRLILYIATVYLISLIVRGATWMRWSAEMIADTGSRGDFLTFSSGLLIFWSAAASIALFLIYVPLALILDHRAKNFSAQLEHSDYESEVEWRKSNGLVSGIGIQLTNALAIAGPILSVVFGPLIHSVLE